MKYLKLLLLIPFITSCSNIDCKPKAYIEPIYKKDSRANLCYAIISNRTSVDIYVVSFTNVPCTKEVLRLIGE